MDHRQVEIDKPQPNMLMPVAAPRRRKFNEEEMYALCKQAVALRNQGKTYRQIAASLGIATSAAYRIVQNMMAIEPDEVIVEERTLEEDVRDECLSLLLHTARPVVAGALAGDLASFRALTSLASTVAKLAAPSRRTVRRRAAKNIREYMNQHDFDLAARRKMARIAQAGGQAEKSRRTTGEQTQQLVVE